MVRQPSRTRQISRFSTVSKINTVLKLVAFGLVALGCGATAGQGYRTVAAPVYQPSDSELQLMEAVRKLSNEHRQKNGCGALSFESRLTSVAFHHTEDMINRDYFGHELAGDPATKLVNRLTAFGYRYSAAGENIAAGQRSPAEVMNSWMNSPGHRRNILNCDFTQIGIAVVAKSSKSLYWTQVFGRPW